MSSGATNLVQQALSWLEDPRKSLALGGLISLQGHEFTGTVEEMGSAVKNFKKGDQVVSPFTVSWSANSTLNADLRRC